MLRLCLVLVLAASPLLAEESVKLAFHSVHFVGSRSVLGQRCNADATISACTRFFARKLDCACEAADAQWRIAAKARFHAVTFVNNADSLQHEHGHIGDIRRDIALHIDKIGALRFDSAEECDSAAKATSAAFEDVMDAIQWTSNSQRHVMQKPFRPRPKLALGLGVRR
jgi:hypothetical protein